MNKTQSTLKEGSLVYNGLSELKHPSNALHSMQAWNDKLKGIETFPQFKDIESGKTFSISIIYEVSDIGLWVNIGVWSGDNIARDLGVSDPDGNDDTLVLLETVIFKTREEIYSFVPGADKAFRYFDKESVKYAILMHCHPSFLPPWSTRK